MRLDEAYFYWITDQIGGCGDHLRVLQYLHSREFTYTIPMDGNRSADGIDLRYRFGSYEGVPDPEIATFIDIRPCSVLEMMIALAVRIEDTIMIDMSEGSDAGKWFWSMIDSLGLSDMTDRYFDSDRAEEIVDTLLDRTYNRDGSGGLFTVSPPPSDMRSLEIWYQMCAYISAIEKY